MQLENKNYANKKQPSLNGQWSDDHLNSLQTIINQPETTLLSGKELKSSKTFVSPLVNDSKWGSLSAREKSFVMEVNMKPTSYCNIKR